MLIRIIKFAITQPKYSVPIMFAHGKSHSESCPVKQSRKVCPGAGGLIRKKALIKRGPICPENILKKGDGGDDGDGKTLKRAKKSGKCRLGFIPEEWFLFFKPKTGVSGPYIFMIGLGNYIVSKEILVMEHEYYSGLSLALVIYLATTKLGPKIASALDDKVDEVANSLKQGRRDELAFNERQIEEAKLAIWRAQGVKDLMNVKKENIALQLEAVYRERLYMVYKVVRRRLNYHVSKRWIEGRIYRKWMIKWVLENVHKSITPDFKKQALADSIKHLNVLASRTKK